MTLRRLDPGPDVAARELVAGLGLREGPGRTVAVMIASADGRAAIDGRSVKLGHPADRALLRETRTAADAVLVGARTVAAERYARLLDDDQTAYRRELGLSDHPLIAVATRSGEIDRDVPLLHEDVPVEVLAGYELPDAVARLRDEHGARAIACEGGPTLLRALIAEGLVDDLLLTVAPLVAGGDEPRVVEGEALAAPAELELHAVHRADHHLFLHYRCS